MTTTKVFGTTTTALNTTTTALRAMTTIASRAMTTIALRAVTTTALRAMIKSDRLVMIVNGAADYRERRNSRQGRRRLLTSVVPCSQRILPSPTTSARLTTPFNRRHGFRNRRSHRVAGFPIVAGCLLFDVARPIQSPKINRTFNRDKGSFDNHSQSRNVAISLLDRYAQL